MQRQQLNKQLLEKRGGGEGGQPYLAALGEVLDVTVASVLTPRDGPSSLLGRILEL